MDSFSIIKVTESGVALIVELQGEMNRLAEKPLMSLRDWPRGLGEEKRALILDFRRVPAISSSGISTLMRIVRSGATGGFQSFGHGVSEHYQMLFRMVGLTQFMMVYPDEYTILQRLE
jgi:anti-anti-sigma factor